ncbi:MAG: PilN domain-containing protein [Burkholderiales bacterium]
MKPQAIDFAPRTFRRALALTGPLTWLFAAVAIALCLGAFVAMRQFERQHSALQARLELAEARVAENTARKPAPKKYSIPAVQADALNSAIEQLNTPWGEIMDAVERATPSSVALLELEPDSKRHVLKGAAEAQTSDTMIAFIRQLKQQALLGNAILTRHEINDQDASRPYRFEFQAEWQEAAP